MSFTQIGDLAHHFLMQRHNNTLKAGLNILTSELASGQIADVGKSLNGNFVLLGDVERSLTVLNGYEIAILDAKLFSDSVQNALEQMQTLSSDLGSETLAASTAGLQASTESVINKARQEFGALVALLNSDVAGRGLFSGAATDSAALASPEEILSALSTSLSGATTISEIVDMVDEWFMSVGGGFETSAYRGSHTSIEPFRLGQDQSVGHELRADSESLRTVLRDTALAVMAGDAGLSLGLEEKNSLLQTSGERLLSQQSELTGIRGDLGYVQERIDEARVMNSSRRSGLEISRNNLIMADPFDTATRLEAAQIQLETLYTVTARLSRLSLVEYLR